MGLSLVLQKVVLDHNTLPAKTQDEFGVPKVSVIPHDVPQHGAISNGDHWLRYRLTVLSQSHSHAAAEQDNFHGWTLDEKSEVSNRIQIRVLVLLIMMLGKINMQLSSVHFQTSGFARVSSGQLVFLLEVQHRRK